MIIAVALGVLVLAQALEGASPEMVAWGGVAALPLVVGVVEVSKRAGLPDRWAGLLALALGISGGILYGGLAGLDPIISLPQGLLVGLAASGAWSTSRHAVGKGGSV